MLYLDSFFFIGFSYPRNLGIPLSSLTFVLLVVLELCKLHVSYSHSTKPFLLPALFKEWRRSPYALSLLKMKVLPFRRPPRHSRILAVEDKGGSFPMTSNVLSLLLFDSHSGGLHFRPLYRTVRFAFLCFFTHFSMHFFISSSTFLHSFFFHLASYSFSSNDVSFWGLYLGSQNYIFTFSLRMLCINRVCEYK